MGVLSQLQPGQGLRGSGHLPWVETRAKGVGLPKQRPGTSARLEGLNGDLSIVCVDEK